jgi:hypothetical protein
VVALGFMESRLQSRELSCVTALGQRASGYDRRGVPVLASQSQRIWQRHRKIRCGTTRAARLIFRYGLEFCREC